MNYYNPPSPSPFSSGSSSSSDSDEDNHGSDFPTNLPGFGDFGDSVLPPPPPNVRRLVAEGEDGGCADSGGNDHGNSGSGYGGGGDDGHNHNHGNRDYMDRLMHLFFGNGMVDNNNNGNGDDDEEEESHRHPRVGSYLDISDGSGTYSYGRAYLHLLLDALTNHPETVQVVDGSYFENMDLQYSASPKYLFRFASNGKVIAKLYVDLPPHTLPPQSSIVDPRPRKDRGSTTICPTCHRTRSRSFDDDNSEEKEAKEGSGKNEAHAEENKQSRGLEDQEMKQLSTDRKRQKSSSDKKKQDTNDQNKKH